MGSSADIWNEFSSDAELITAARGGDTSAFGALYERHAPAARAVARQYTRSSADAEDVVADAFMRVFAVVRAGGGPDVAFRAYLFTVVRRLAYAGAQGDRRVQPTDDMAVFETVFGSEGSVEDPALAGFERGVVARAYATLPERWQAALWYTEVERLSAAQIAPLLGLTPNGVAALSYRAREGLRQAYLQQHLAAPPHDSCRGVNDKLGAYVRGGLSRRETVQVEAHLDECVECHALVLELGDVNHGMRAVIAPLILGLAGLGVLAHPLPLGGLVGVGAGIVAGSGALAGTATGTAVVGAAAGTAGVGAAAAGSAAVTGSVAVGAVAGTAVTGSVVAGSVAAAGTAAAAGSVAVGALAVGAMAGTAAAAGTVAVAAAGSVVAGAVAGSAAAVAVVSGGIAALASAIPTSIVGAVVAGFVVASLAVAGPTGAQSDNGAVQVASVSSLAPSPVDPVPAQAAIQPVVTVTDGVASANPAGWMPGVASIGVAVATPVGGPVAALAAPPPPLTAADLRASARGGGLALTAGSEALLAFDIENAGQSPAHELRAELTLPEGLAFVGSQPETDLIGTGAGGSSVSSTHLILSWVCVPPDGSGTVICTAPDLPGLSTAGLIVRTRVAEGVVAVNAGLVLNVVSDTARTQLISNATIGPAPARLAIDPIEQVYLNVGEAATVTLPVRNAGGVEAHAVRVVITLPEGVAWDGTETGVWACLEASGPSQLECSVSVVAPRGSVPLPLSLRADERALVDPAPRLSISCMSEGADAPVALDIAVTVSSPHSASVAPGIVAVGGTDVANGAAGNGSAGQPPPLAAPGVCPFVVEPPFALPAPSFAPVPDSGSAVHGSTDPTPAVTDPTPVSTDPTPAVTDPTPVVTDPTPAVTDPTTVATDPTSVPPS